MAAGSGIPQIKCYLNGVKIPHVVRIKVIIGSFKILLILSVKYTRSSPEATKPNTCQTTTPDFLSSFRTSLNLLHLDSVIQKSNNVLLCMFAFPVVPVTSFFFKLKPNCLRLFSPSFQFESHVE